MSVKEGLPSIRKCISNVTAIRGGDSRREIRMRAFNVGAPAGCRAGYITEGQSLAGACSQLHPDLSYLSFHKFCFIPALEM